MAAVAHLHAVLYGIYVTIRLTVVNSYLNTTNGGNFVGQRMSTITNIIR